jgi:hypothetical protein
MRASQSGGGIVVFSETWSLGRVSTGKVAQKRESILLSMDSLEHKQSTTQVAVTLLGNPLLETLTACVTFLLSDLSQDSTDLVFGGCSNSDKQGTTSNRSNDITRTVGQKDQAQVGTVFLHSSS